MMAGAPRLATRFAENSALVASGEPSPFLNRLAIGPGGDPERFLIEGVAAAIQGGHPSTVVFTPEIAAALARPAQRLGLVPHDDLPLMVLAPKADLAGPESVGTIRRATQLHSIETTVTLLLRSLDAPGGFTTQSILRTIDVGSMAKQGVSIFLCDKDGLPASTVTAVHHRESVGLWRMATSREFQRQGIGRALLLDVIDFYRARGATRFYLNATKAGLPLYRSLGFETIGHHAIWQLGT